MINSKRLVHCSIDLPKHDPQSLNVILMSMFQLPRGVTGFGSRPTVDAEHFRGCLYDARHRCGYRVLADANDSLIGTRSYTSFVIQQQGIATLLLLNLHGPFVGFAAGQDQQALIHNFIDCTDLADEFVSFRPLDSTVLNASPSPNQLALLSASERKQVNYWKPERIGDIVFNWWD